MWTMLRVTKMHEVNDTKEQRTVEKKKLEKLYHPYNMKGNSERAKKNRIIKKRLHIMRIIETSKGNIKHLLCNIDEYSCILYKVRSRRGERKNI